jgi:pyruvate dehydrogenase E2 component (dihydrolipoamide acetyltransferase)
MPRQGQSVESCIIAAWKKQKGEPVTQGEVLCEAETDKALLEIESPASGVLLELFFGVGDNVPVLTNIAVIGQPGEEVESFRPAGANSGLAQAVAPASIMADKAMAQAAGSASPPEIPANTTVGVSPRAKKLATQKGLALAGLLGTGPGGRIIERDVVAALAEIPKITPLARTMAAQGGFAVPSHGSGVSGRVLAGDLAPVSPQPSPSPAVAVATSTLTDEVETIPVKGIRKVIAERMLASLQTTAQLTLNASADARALLAYRQRLKTSAENLELRNITLNDLLLFVVSRTLTRHPDLNALFTGEAIARYQSVHLAFAVDTPRGLIVPVIRQADTLNLKQIALEARRLAAACLDGTIKADELSGGTFTVTNLGSFGIESFSPVLNPPQVGILGVGGINLKPVDMAGNVEFVPHLGLSLTINHQVVDGAPGARFLQALSQGLAQIDLLLAT